MPFQLGGHFIGIVNDNGESRGNRFEVDRSQFGDVGFALAGLKVPQRTVNCIARGAGQQCVGQRVTRHAVLQSRLCSTAAVTVSILSP